MEELLPGLASTDENEQSTALSKLEEQVNNSLCYEIRSDPKKFLNAIGLCASH